jgi:hypothetical protein
MHRLYHVPAVGQAYVDHFADGYDEVIALAKSNGTESTHDSEALQYFALEAYAFDIAVSDVRVRVRAMTMDMTPALRLALALPLRPRLPRRMLPVPLLMCHR